MRIAAFDLESTALSAMMGRILCGSILEIVPEHLAPCQPYTFRGDKKPWLSVDPLNDSGLCTALRDELEQYNMLVSWNGKLFDVPLLNARLAKFGERPLKPQLHLDAMYYARGVGLRIGSSKLANVQKYFQTDQAKTDISWEDWQRAALGDHVSMDEVVSHCEADVKVLADMYWRLLPMVANIHR